MDRHAVKDAGYSLTIIAVILLIAGLVAEFYSLRTSTPDPPFFYGTRRPYQIYALPLLIAVVPTLLIGIFLLWKVRKQK